MSEELHLVTDLAVILIAAGVFTIIFKALKQPLILGYIIAGFIVSPHLGLFPKLTSMEAVSQWSEIGIIFLLFELGLEFSFKKLLKVGNASLIMAVTKCIGMFIIGLLAGSAFGWTMMESIFLGGLLGMSSTTIIIKAYDDLDLKRKPYAPMIFGSLVVEDLIAVLLLVLLSTLAVSNKFAGSEMLFGIGKLIFFIVLWFVVGIYLIPTVIKKTRKWLSDEILLIVSIGLCFGMVAIASAVGFSSALGAFVMGSILSETVESERIIKLTGSIKDLFGAIFFVSVGMMVDPAVIGEHWGVILLITIVAMGGILIFSTAGGLIAGQGLEKSVHAGFSLAQLGEFAFIIASLGCSLGVMRDFIYPVIIAVSVITTFTTPYMIKAAGPAYKWLQAKLPAKVLAIIEPKDNTNAEHGAAESSEWKTLLKYYFLRVGIYGIVLVAIILGSSLFLDPLLTRTFENWSPFVHNLVCCVLTLVVMSPFLYGLAFNSGGINKSASKLLKSNPANRWPILSLALLRAALVVGFAVIAITQNFTLNFWAILIIILAGVASIFLGRLSIHNVSHMEQHFLTNLNEKEVLEAQQKPVASLVASQLAGYDVHIETLDISPDSEFVGKRLREMPFRHTAGANIVKIQRGHTSILIPGGDEVIYPYDRILAVGSTEQIEAFRKIMEVPEMTTVAEDQEFIVRKIKLEEDSLYIGKSLRELSMRKYGCMVISLMRGGEFKTNPGPETVFEAGDIIWIAGEAHGVDLCCS